MKLLFTIDLCPYGWPMHFTAGAAAFGLLFKRSEVEK